jgi:hypothetical protein
MIMIDDSDDIDGGHDIMVRKMIMMIMMMIK